MKNKTAVTTQQPFDHMDSAPLFCVNAGVPIEEALERAADLMLYVETIAAADAFIDKTMEAGIVQTLSEMGNALFKACDIVGGRPRS